MKWDKAKEILHSDPELVKELKSNVIEFEKIEKAIREKLQQEKEKTIDDADVGPYMKAWLSLSPEEKEMIYELENRTD